jgi:cellulase/cellobiase CelA1
MAHVRVPRPGRAWPAAAVAGLVVLAVPVSARATSPLPATGPQVVTTTYNHGPTSPPPVVPSTGRTPTDPPGSIPVNPNCQVTYTIPNHWTGSFNGQVVVTNTGTTTINGWTVRWTFADGQQIVTPWGALISWDGGAVTAVNASWNGVLAPGASAWFGFLATDHGTNTIPSPKCY